MGYWFGLIKPAFKIYHQLLFLRQDYNKLFHSMQAELSTIFGYEFGMGLMFGKTRS